MKIYIYTWKNFDVRRYSRSLCFMHVYKEKIHMYIYIYASLKKIIFIITRDINNQLSKILQRPSCIVFIQIYIYIYTCFDSVWGGWGLGSKSLMRFDTVGYFFSMMQLITSFCWNSMFSFHVFMQGSPSCRETSHECIWRNHQQSWLCKRPILID